APRGRGLAGGTARPRHAPRAALRRSRPRGAGRPHGARPRGRAVSARPHVVAVGVFDGLHRGHRRIVDTGLARAQALGVGMAVVTFDPHPDAVLGKAAAEPPLTPAREKEALLKAWGVDPVVVLPFD